jgi:hypothetical protein
LPQAKKFRCVITSVKTLPGMAGVPVSTSA